ncbi:unnamed protein product, partial [Ectocarpus sp. 13 AM-2016]
RVRVRVLDVELLDLTVFPSPCSPWAFVFRTFTWLLVGTRWKRAFRDATSSSRQLPRQLPPQHRLRLSPQRWVRRPRPVLWNDTVSSTPVS